MDELIEIIDEIIKYGLAPDVKVENKVRDLEKHLVRLYGKYFQINYQYDETDYPDFDKNDYPEIQNNIQANFPDFGIYHMVLDPHKIMEEPELAAGNATDDLTDIIWDLMEIKWRHEYNSDSDAWWYFELVFPTHVQHHLIRLLRFLKEKYG